MLTWAAPFDPNETMDYDRDWTDSMTAMSDTLQSIGFSVITENTGLGIVSTDIDATSMIAKVWFTADDIPTLQGFNGMYILIDHTATTLAGRVFNETIRLKIKEK